MLHIREVTIEDVEWAKGNLTLVQVKHRSDGYG